MRISGTRGEQECEEVCEKKAVRTHSETHLLLIIRWPLGRDCLIAAKKAKRANCLSGSRTELETETRPRSMFHAHLPTMPTFSTCLNHLIV
ncbi:Protein of unknown function [Pyronema omphalodes CBS 100304]|uniref:Uncharacterized protein n=1 Tax=Pyronema omphalodes (strain CBS 100304) TaxID=1076935 RepID=U4LG48_PYROM|nr:Protein of unknown function [Pyronema omphalodes CBS 100304]